MEKELLTCKSNNSNSIMYVCDKQTNICFKKENNFGNVINKKCNNSICPVNWICDPKTLKCISITDYIEKYIK